MSLDQLTTIDAIKESTAIDLSVEPHKLLSLLPHPTGMTSPRQRWLGASTQAQRVGLTLEQPSPVRAIPLTLLLLVTFLF